MKKCRHNWVYMSLNCYQCSKCGAHKTREVGGRWYYWHKTDPWNWYYKRRCL